MKVSRLVLYSVMTGGYDRATTWQKSDGPEHGSQAERTDSLV